jgi:uncharacterized membrane protein
VKKMADLGIVQEFYHGLIEDEERRTFRRLLRMSRKRREEVVETLLADQAMAFDDITKKALLEMPPMTRKEIARALARRTRWAVLEALAAILGRLFR